MRDMPNLDIPSVVNVGQPILFPSASSNDSQHYCYLIKHQSDENWHFQNWSNEEFCSIVFKALGVYHISVYIKEKHTEELLSNLYLGSLYAIDPETTYRSFTANLERIRILSFDNIDKNEYTYLLSSEHKYFGFDLFAEIEHNYDDFCKKRPESYNDLGKSIFYLNQVARIWSFGNALNTRKPGGATNNEYDGIVDPKHISDQYLKNSYSVGCSDLVAILSTLIFRAGIECRVVDVAQHCMCEIQVNGKWWILDPTYNLMLDLELKRALRRYTTPTIYQFPVEGTNYNSTKFRTQIGSHYFTYLSQIANGIIRCGAIYSVFGFFHSLKHGSFFIGKCASSRAPNQSAMPLAALPSPNNSDMISLERSDNETVADRKTITGGNRTLIQEFRIEQNPDLNGLDVSTYSQIGDLYFSRLICCRLSIFREGYCESQSCFEGVLGREAILRDLIDHCNSTILLSQEYPPKIKFLMYSFASGLVAASKYKVPKAGSDPDSTKSDDIEALFIRGTMPENRSFSQAKCAYIVMRLLHHIGVGIQILSWKNLVFLEAKVDNEDWLLSVDGGLICRAGLSTLQDTRKPLSLITLDLGRKFDQSFIVNRPIILAKVTALFTLGLLTNSQRHSLDDWLSERGIASSELDRRS